MLQPVTASKLGSLSLLKAEHMPLTFEGLFNQYFSLEMPAGMLARYKVDKVMTDDPAQVLNALADHFRRAPSTHAHVLAGYGMNLQLHDDACFSSIANCYMGCYAIWDDAANDDKNYAWLGKASRLMQPWAKGHYQNEVEPRFNPDRLQQCFSTAAWQRLEQLRAKYDPDGVFHHYLRDV